VAVAGLTLELNPGARPTHSGFMTIAQLCDHFEQRELSNENTWRSHATKKIYKAYLTLWIRPHRQECRLCEVRTIKVESAKAGGGGLVRTGFSSLDRIFAFPAN
jgi:hypothetical protein